MTNSGVKMKDRVLEFVLEQLNRSKRENLGTIVVGISGVQGSGKTTLTRNLVVALSEQDIRVEALSIDDFYLPHSHFVTHPSKNPLLQQRGLPGTHDIELCTRTLQTLRSGEIAKVPIYDKSVHDGKGDRVGWRDSVANVDVVLFEGWMLGFRSLDEESLSSRLASLPPSSFALKYSLACIQEINDNLASYTQWYHEIDAFVHMDPVEIAYAFVWRQQQEDALWSEKGAGLSEEQVREFVGRFLVVCEVYLPQLRRGFFSETESRGRHLRLVQNERREIVEEKIF
ncbi:uncharacterized protein VTP21DRAFT_2329 [Calcarisporiella thermophila]|uniref:uncharacterized protein n=1 Tax=Calcarisporiella thermophila TaxID=911321 RepID=UPI0037425FF8